MTDHNDGVQVLYSLAGDAVGVYIAQALWSEVEQEVQPLLRAARSRMLGEQEPVEPLQDWQLLVANWDFKYPVDTKVVCGECGLSTQDWQADEPRKFRLKAANLGGLVVFACQGCGARVSKRHFKDGIKMETTPQKKG